MPIAKLPAHQFRFEINAGTEAVPDWLPIGGVNTWSPSPTDNTADVTDFDSEDADGNAVTEHLPIRRGFAWTLGGLTEMDETTGERDPGQAAVEAMARKTGYGGLAQFRQVHKTTGAAKTCLASFGGIGGGGGNDDPNAWGVTVTASGAIVDSTLPALPAAPTAPAGTAAAGQSIVTWTLAGGPYIRYEVIVFLAGVEEARVQSTAKPILVPLTAGTRTVKVRAQNAAGWGPESVASANITTT